MTSPPHSSDLRLIDAFRPSLLSLLPPPDEPVHAEALLALCVGDGLLEVLEWSREGTGADPAASMWLAALRWHHVITGTFPAGAPQPPPRPTSHALRLIVDTAGVELIPGSAHTSLSGLSSAEMGTRRAPPQPEADDDAALLRILPISCLPYVETPMKQDWAETAICLTHGSSALIREARHRAAHPPTPVPLGPRHELLEVVVEDLDRRWREVTLPKR
ncbi:hypothetical protein [Nesterenkonia natronophila]|uniref:hypothetical protein n=1 Tax=Nesterenkonia natronophila TaxID=2174932 RepID=UPI0011C3E996|nr:hypothetical protein [Nesterenkonia natronophila]